MTIGKVSDRTFLVHLGGKIEIQPKLPIRNRDDLSMIYTPGVARICLAIAENPDDARRLTIKRNTVAVVTDGSAVLGLGNLGALAALPVMEGKAALFKRFAGIDAFPICLDTQDVDEIVRAVELIAPVFAGINLEDISAPRCFEIERRLRASLDIPVFHDDQHGTAIVVLAALTNALKVVGKDIGERPDRAVRRRRGRHGDPRRCCSRRVPSTWSWPTRTASCTPDRDGSGRRAGVGGRAARTRAGCTGDLRAALAGADVFIGVSAPEHPHRRRHRDDGDGRDRVRAGQSRCPRSTRRPRPSTPRSSRAAAATSPTRSTTCSPSPGSSAGCSTPTAARSPWRRSSPPPGLSRPWSTDDELNASYIVPSVFHPDVSSTVAAAVRKAVRVGDQVIVRHRLRRRDPEPPGSA